MNGKFCLLIPLLKFLRRKTKKTLIKILFQGKKILILNQFSKFFFDFKFDENSRKYENFIKNRDFNPRSPSEFFFAENQPSGKVTVPAFASLLWLLLLPALFFFQLHPVIFSFSSFFSRRPLPFIPIVATGLSRYKTLCCTITCVWCRSDLLRAVLPFMKQCLIGRS